MPEASIKDVKDYFGLKPGETLKDFTQEWNQLSDVDKSHIRTGIGDGTFNY